MLAATPLFHFFLPPLIDADIFFAATPDAMLTPFRCCLSADAARHYDADTLIFADITILPCFSLYSSFDYFAIFRCRLPRLPLR